jgi:DNA-binding NarL/FixJ family response regulator
VTISVLVADDQDMVRTGFGMIIGDEPDMAVVGEAADGEAAVAKAVALRPDVVLLDVRMPGMDGVEATRLIAAHEELRSRVLILTTFDLDEYVYQALRHGASGFLLKNAPAATLLEGIRVVAAGEALLAPSVTARLIQRVAGWSLPGSSSPELLDRLTAREADTLRLVARGMSNAEIAAVLGVGPATVKSHVASLLGKLGVRDRSQAVVLAYESGFMRPGASG